eukprot:1620772-Prymnesium_polylepis.2
MCAKSGVGAPLRVYSFPSRWCGCQRRRGASDLVVDLGRAVALDRAHELGRPDSDRPCRRSRAAAARRSPPRGRPS